LIVIKTEHQRGIIVITKEKDMKILVILGHPAKNRHSFCEALANAYAGGAKESGHDVVQYKIAEKHFNLLSEGYVDVPAAEPAIAEARTHMAWADHIVFVYPLWEFMIPALLKGFLERVLILGGSGTDPGKKVLRLTSKSFRLIQTSGMPGFIYRYYFMAHGAKALRDMLKFSGARRVSAIYFGVPEGAAATARRKKFLDQTRQLGTRGV
jgi:NAD(P)H dehydrogenase (quinone)